MKTEKELLQVLGNAFVEGSVEKLLPLLTDDCLYHSDLSWMKSIGKDAIAKRWSTVNAQQNKTPYCFEIIPSGPVVRKIEALPEIYGGRDCIKLSLETPDNTAALVFIKIDESGLISEILLSRDPKYLLITPLLKDSPLSVTPIPPRGPNGKSFDYGETMMDEYMKGTGDTLRALYSRETLAEMMEEKRRWDKSVYVWKEADVFMRKWLPDNGYRIVKSEIDLDCIGYRCERRGLNYTIFLFAYGELITTLLDGDYCKDLLDLSLSRDSTVLVAYLKVKKEESGNDAVTYHVLNYTGKKAPIDLWEPRILNGRNILRFFTRKEMTDAIFEFIWAFNEQNLDMLQALLAPHPGLSPLEKPEGRLMNDWLYSRLASLFKKHGQMKTGYMRYNSEPYCHSLVPYLEGHGFFSLSFDDRDKIQLIAEHPFNDEFHEFIFDDGQTQIPESSMKRTPDIAAVEFLRPETTQRYAMKLSFQNGETRKYAADVTNKGYFFTDKIFANGWISKKRPKPQGREYDGYPPCGQGVEFVNGFSIGKMQLYRDSVPFYEEKTLSEVVFENENCVLTKICEWQGSRLHFDKEAGLYKVLLPGGRFFNNGCFGTFAFADGRRATSLEFNYMSSFQEGLCLVGVEGHGFGYLDQDLRFVIPPRFNRAGNFKNGFAKVSLLENEQDRWFFIDKTGKEIVFKKPDGAKTGGEYKILSAYSESMMRVSTMEKPDLAYQSDSEAYAGFWGFVDEQGVEIVSPRYIYAMDFQDGLAEVCKGEWTIDEKWDNEYRSGAFWTEEELWGMIDGMGREVVPCVFDEVRRFWIPGNGEDEVCRDYFGAHFGGWAEGKWGIIDRSGKWVVEPMFHDLGNDLSSDGCFQYYNYKKWISNDEPDTRDDPIMGVYSIPDNRVIFDPQFVDVDFLDGGLFRVEYWDTKRGTGPRRHIDVTRAQIIDRKGSALFPSEYTFIWERGDYYEVVIREIDKPDRHGLIDKNGAIVLPCEYDVPFNGINIKERRFIFQESGKQGVMDFDKNVIVPAMYDEIHGLGSDFLVVESGEKDRRLRGLLLPDGSQVLPMVYDSIDIDGERVTVRDKNGSALLRLVKKQGA
ncbi:MAG: WG repeat-containing protein [Synergistaceae bacterium]|nr:WG repeat-containing protein [Synergistaceae bacterium]